MTINQFGIPGQTDATFTYHADVLWGGDVTRIPLLTKNAVIDGSARDAGNGNTPTIIRPGLLLGRVTATGKLKEYNPAATDGTENIAGVNGVELSMVDLQTGASEDKFTGTYVVAPIKASQLLVLGQPLVGHPAEAATRTKLRVNFWLDDEL